MIGKAEQQDKTLESAVYQRLLQIARRQRWQSPDKNALGTRSIVHEAYVRLADDCSSPMADAFLLQASKVMRSVVLDNARYWTRSKRGGNDYDVSIDSLNLASMHRADELIALDAALNDLAAIDERLVQVVECRVFGGLSFAEIATALQVSVSTVKRDWTAARTLLAAHFPIGND